MFSPFFVQGQTGQLALDFSSELLYDYRHSMRLLPCSNAASLPLAALLVVLDAGCAPAVKWELYAGAA